VRGLGGVWTTSCLCYFPILYVRSPAAFLDDSISSPPLLPRMLTKPRTVYGCQPVALHNLGQANGSFISSFVVPNPTSFSEDMAWDSTRNRLWRTAQQEREIHQADGRIDALAGAHQFRRWPCWNKENCHPTQNQLSLAQWYCQCGFRTGRFEQPEDEYRFPAKACQQMRLNTPMRILRTASGIAMPFFPLPSDRNLGRPQEAESVRTGTVPLLEQPCRTCAQNKQEPSNQQINGGRLRYFRVLGDIGCDEYG